MPRIAGWARCAPNQAGIKADEVEAYVQSISQETGEFLQIVNHNLAGVQYAVAGTIKGLDACSGRSCQGQGSRRQEPSVVPH